MGVNNAMVMLQTEHAAANVAALVGKVVVKTATIERVAVMMGRRRVWILSAAFLRLSVVHRGDVRVRVFFAGLLDFYGPDGLAIGSF